MSTGDKGKSNHLLPGNGYKETEMDRPEIEENIFLNILMKSFNALRHFKDHKKCLKRIKYEEICLKKEISEIILEVS